MNEFSNFLEKYGSNFLVAAMVPALALVVASIIVFDPIIQLTKLFEKQNSVYQLVGFGLVLFVFTVIIGFTLTALNTYILKLYEGYVFFHRIPIMHRRMLRSYRRKAHALARERKVLKNRIRVLETTFADTPRTADQLEKLKQRYYGTVSLYDHEYPPSLGEVLPTQFGNILRASEVYPGDRYGMDGVEFWPRLLHVIPSDYRTSIEESRNELSFLVNMSILSIAFYLLCVIAMFYSLGTPPENLSGARLFFAVMGELLRYIASAGIALACSGFFYRASIYSVRSFGLMIRSAYDLFRFDLLKQLKMKMPANYQQEFETWNNLTEFIVMGRHTLGFEQFEYDIQGDSSPKQMPHQSQD